MAVKPLNAAQKQVMASLARAFVATELDTKVEGMEGFKKHCLKTDPEAAQAERAFQKAVMAERANICRGMKKDGA